MTAREVDQAVDGEVVPVDFEFFDGWCGDLSLPSEFDGIAVQLAVGGPGSDPFEAVVDVIYVNDREYFTPSGARIGMSSAELQPTYPGKLAESAHEYRSEPTFDFVTDLYPAGSTIRFRDRTRRRGCDTNGHSDTSSLRAAHGRVLSSAAAS